jgi:putative nucleotidyltransferase with HDIG domain
MHKLKTLKPYNNKIKGAKMDYEKFFEKYSLKYKKDFPEMYDAYHLKEIHCKNVSKEARNLAESIGLNKKDIDFIAAAGLFHDIGRFPQFAQFQTFNDLISCDHGKKSAKEAVKTGLIYEFEKDKRDIFLSCLFFHNKKEIPEFKNSSKKQIKSFFLKILKDADKLDIYRVVCENYTDPDKNSNIISMNFDDSGKISSKIVSDILNKKPASTSDVKSLTDLKLSQLSWVFDLHFDYSLKQVEKRGYIEEIFSTIDPCKKSNQCKNVISEFLNSSILRP